MWYYSEDINHDILLFMPVSVYIVYVEARMLNELTLKEAGGGGGPKWPTGQTNVCHFSHGHAMVTKNLDFIHKHPN